MIQNKTYKTVQNINLNNLFLIIQNFLQKLFLYEI